MDTDKSHRLTLQNLSEQYRQYPNNNKMLKLVLGMERRAFLATSGIGAITLLAGCLGGNSDSNESGDENGDDDGLETSPNGDDGDSDNGEPAPEPVEADGIVGETIEKDGVAITVEEIARGETATDGLSDFEALENELFIGYEAQVEVVGEEPALIPDSTPVSASYLGGQTSGPPLPREGAAVDGNSISPWESGDGELFPGESLSGGYIVGVPANEFNAKNLLLTHSSPQRDVVKIRGGAGDPSPPYQSSPAEPGTYSFGERVNERGLEFTVTGYTLGDTIERKPTTGPVDEPPSDASQFIITTFEAENVSPIVRGLPGSLDLYYAESRMEGQGVAVTNFEAAGEEFTGLYSPASTRGNRKTNGNSVYPGITVTGALAFVVPQQFDASNVEVRMEGGDITFTP